MCTMFQLYVIGTPAEEGGGGKLRMIEGGAFKDVDLAMMTHPFIVNISYKYYLCIEQYVVVSPKPTFLSCTLPTKFLLQIC